MKTIKDLRWILFIHELYGCTAKMSNKSKVCQDMIRIAEDMIYRGAY